eukprot:TRINITY_DN67167_c5_g8_i1.p1 TRINITY_DN67167_c5_g8~~TRINITY_DN67167_c5_g8_i1.p1  ORF type:complete len:213 (-),score=20.18 TRINITY_DN67167_c5_g8_i1:154-792(-)
MALSVAVLGSSVAAGYYSTRNQGWAYHLNVALKARYPKDQIQFQNYAIPGANTAQTLKVVKQLISKWKQGGAPQCVIIGLSVANEGLLWLPSNEVVSSFTTNMKKMVQLLKDAGVRKVFLGGLYPNNDYTPEMYTVLQQVDKQMSGWADGKLDFLSVMDDKHGHWKAGLWEDGSHPNTEGHLQMFKGIDLTLFDALANPACKQPEAEHDPHL